MLTTYSQNHLHRTLVIAHISVVLLVCFWITFGFSGLERDQELPVIGSLILVPSAIAILLLLARLNRLAKTFALSVVAVCVTLLCYPFIYAGIFICLWSLEK